MISAILGIIVFGAMLALLYLAMKETNKRLDSSSRRTMPPDAADKAKDGSRSS
jgi:hypothetical protein